MAEDKRNQRREQVQRALWLVRADARPQRTHARPVRGMGLSHA